MKEVYLLTTDHLENCLWFRDEDDFKVAMNHVAIQAACRPKVSVLSFILMSNHVHFVLYGIGDDAQEFVNQFKSRYSQYFSGKYGIKGFLRRNKIDIRSVSSEDEAIERAIAYVQMNCVAANICSHPSQYAWGTGNAFFTQTMPSCMQIGSMSARSRERLFHSNYNNLPENWLVSDDGYIIPQSYVDIQIVETLFRTPRRMNYFLNSSSKAKKRIETAEENLPTFRDQTILNVIPELCRSLFHKNSFLELKENEQTELARQIRFRFSSDANQIARVCGISYSRAAYLLDSI